MVQKSPVRYVTGIYGKFTGIRGFATGIHVYSTADVTGYVLLLTDDSNQLRCGQVANLSECECANITNPVGYIPGCDFIITFGSFFKNP